MNQETWVLVLPFSPPQWIVRSKLWIRSLFVPSLEEEWHTQLTLSFCELSSLSANLVGA
jgi:hypothetical protein